MDLAQQLVRSCVRSFYDTKHVLVIDALIIHSALRDDHLAYLMAMNTKEVHKLCGKLKEARFIDVKTRPELREGQQRPMHRTYYFIDYRATIDAIKWRVFNIDKIVQGSTKKDEELKAFACPRCKAEWTEMECIDLVGPNGFICHRCAWQPLTALARNQNGGHEASSKLNSQFKFITDMLPEIDQVVIPANTFEDALKFARPVNRDESNPAAPTIPVVSSSDKPAAVRGLDNVGPTSIAITLTDGSGPSAADIAAEQARKEKFALQNALPAHFTHSTITGAQVKFDNQPTFTSAPVEDKKDVIENEDDTELDSYFAQLAAENAKAAEKEQEEEEETDDEEDEEGFEDVIVNGSGSGAATPASSLGAQDAKPATSNGILKRNSASISGNSTPVEDKPAKKVKIEEPSQPEVKADEESEEDMEFEGVN